MIEKENDMKFEAITVLHENGKYLIAQGVPNPLTLQSFEFTKILNDGIKYNSKDDAWTIARDLANLKGLPLVDPNTGVEII